MSEPNFLDPALLGDLAQSMTLEEINEAIDDRIVGRPVNRETPLSGERLPAKQNAELVSCTRCAAKLVRKYVGEELQCVICGNADYSGWVPAVRQRRGDGTANG